MKMTDAKLEKLVSGGLRSCINDHGPITQYFIASATKRIVGAIEGHVLNIESDSLLLLKLQKEKERNQRLRRELSDAKKHLYVKEEEMPRKKKVPVLVITKDDALALIGRDHSKYSVIEDRFAGETKLRTAYELIFGDPLQSELWMLRYEYSDHSRKYDFESKDEIECHRVIARSKTITIYEEG